MTFFSVNLVLLNFWLNYKNWTESLKLILIYWVMLIYLYKVTSGVFINKKY